MLYARAGSYQQPSPRHRLPLLPNFRLLRNIWPCLIFQRHVDWLAVDDIYREKNAVAWRQNQFSVIVLAP